MVRPTATSCFSRSLISLGGEGGLLVGGGVAVDADGAVYVADSHAARVQCFDPHGRFLAAWGRTGPTDSHFVEPAGLVVDQQGHVYVADSGAHRIYT